MSDSEKGFAIMEAGLKVMAGQSPNAIVNIAEGLKGLGPQFAKDAKEKRAWDRQVDLSAAKYALDGMSKERALVAAETKEERQLLNKVFAVRPGQTFKYQGKTYTENDRIIPTVGSIRDGSFPLDAVQTETSLLEQMKAYRLKTKAQLDLLGEKVIAPNKFSKDARDYVDDSMRVRTNVATKSLLNRALVELQKPGGKGPLGVKATAKNALLAMANAVGQKQYAESVFGKLDTQKKYSDWTNRAVTTQIEGLINEGGKITDQERELAKEIGGALSKGAFSGVFEDREKLERQLRDFSSALTRDSEGRIRKMGLLEESWKDHYSSIGNIKTGRSYGSLLRESRGPLAPPSSRAAKVLPGSINWKDIINVSKKGVISYNRGWNKK